MSGSVYLASAFAPVIVVTFGCSRFSDDDNDTSKKKKKTDDDNSYWHVCESLCWRPSSALSFSLFILIFILILCSIDGVKGNEIATSSTSNYNNGVPAFDVNDLRNLIEIFPEFRDYVMRVVSSQLEKQQQQYQSSEYVTTTTVKTVAPLNKPTFGGNNVYHGETLPISRRDFLTLPSTQNSNHPPADRGQQTTILSKHSYGWPHYDDYHPIHDHHSHHHHHGYGYGSPSHSHKGWGWTADNEPYKDPKFHYQVGYQLGKDVSCVLGLLGFKSIKDFSIHSLFSFFKKLKYLVLIGLAFKLGVILSPIALPMLFPIILLAVIAKILPLLLIVVLLFKLLKTQLKLGIGRKKRENSNNSGDITNAAGTASNLLEGTNISRLWKSIDDVTQSVMESESCVEKFICNMMQRADRSYNVTIAGVQDTGETKKTVVSKFFGAIGSMPNSLLKTMDWIFSQHFTGTRDGSPSNIWECDKIQCSYINDE